MSDARRSSRNKRKDDDSSQEDVSSKSNPCPQDMKINEINDGNETTNTLLSDTSTTSTTMSDNALRRGEEGQKTSTYQGKTDLDSNSDHDSDLATSLLPDISSGSSPSLSPASDIDTEESENDHCKDTNSVIPSTDRHQEKDEEEKEEKDGEKEEKEQDEKVESHTSTDDNHDTNNIDNDIHENHHPSSNITSNDNSDQMNVDDSGSITDKDDHEQKHGDSVDQKLELSDKCHDQNGTDAEIDAGEGEESGTDANEGHDDAAAVEDKEGADVDDANEVVDKEENGDADDDDEDEQWDLTHVFTIEEITQRKEQCSTKKCPLVACSTYLSSLDKDKEDPWYSCIDCQEKDFGGWPETVSEYPITFMTEEHRQVIVQHCTGRYSPDMPCIPTVSEKNGGDGGTVESDNGNENENEDGNEHTNTESKSDSEQDVKAPTKPPTSPSAISTSSDDSISKSSPQQTNTQTQQGKDTTTTTNMVTSTTPPPNGLTHDKSKTSKSLVTPSPVPPSAKRKGNNGQPSKQAVAIHKKWQEEARKLGGGRIIVKKPDAKKLIFDVMKDSFRPMNITQVFKTLNGVVPSAVLKSCLGDMALDNFSKESQFADSDSEDENESKSSSSVSKTKNASINTSDAFSGSLSMKLGRNANTILYYVDYSKLFNNGNGLLPDDKNQLLSDHALAKLEQDSIRKNIKQMSSDTTKLISEPTNEDLMTNLEHMEENASNLREEVEASRELKANEQIKKQTKKKIDTMALQWRKRKRLCMDFLMFMEETTEGTVSIKKCFSGDGQMDIDSDEAVVKGAITWIKQKRDRKSIRGRGGGKRPRVNGRTIGSNKKQKVGNSKGSSSNSIEPDESFIGVELTSRGVQRVYMDSEE